MTLGREFLAFATTIGEDIERVDELVRLFREVNLGATAIGTGRLRHGGNVEGADAGLS
jgi:aspartate ammonia-lyase